MISVIVPVYNVEKYIDRCIDSVLKQTYTDFELILIDDGSTDKSGEMCDVWANKDSRIKLIRKENEGLGPTRNLGVKLSKCDYITFLDSDDWWDERYLEMMMFPAEKYLVDIICCDIHYWEIKGNAVEDKISKLRITPNKVMYTSEDKDIINRARTFAWGKVFKKSLFVDNNIEQPAHAFEDIPVVPLVVALSDTIYRVDEPLYYYYRNRKGSLANNYKMLLHMEKALIELIDIYKKYDLFTLYNKELSKLVYSQCRFIVNRNRILSNDISSEKFDRVFENIISQNFVNSININDNIYCIGTGVAAKIVEKFNTSGNCVNGNDFLIADLTEKNIIDDIKYELQNNNKIRKVFVLDREDSNKSNMKKYNEIEREYIDKIKILYNIPSRQVITENQLWDLADSIFYSI